MELVPVHQETAEGNAEPRPNASVGFKETDGRLKVSRRVLAGRSREDD
jgi:hypothetical protein